ncbi:hypothetical protein QYE76_070808 [Lolium multiflorum]|uniref:Transposase (putative) gypsy type domain-containing protein n=1 Tax=Lolium multiflorum TaxID=4521 RepID=A0AAD8SK28_LOLMU|nr:hypothetical protein QYE76_070808 [Lolium multiflorum]
MGVAPESRSRDGEEEEYRRRRLAPPAESARQVLLFSSEGERSERPSPAPGAAGTTELSGPSQGQVASPSPSVAEGPKLRIDILRAGDVILPVRFLGFDPHLGFYCDLLSFLHRGLSLPTHGFLLHLLRTYEIKVQLTPNSILHVAVFITLCEAFLGIEPHFGLWKKIFYVKRYSSSNGYFVTGGVGFVARSEVNYFNFPMRESVQGWRLKWFYVKDSSSPECRLPCYADVSEAKPKDSWKNILSADERASAEELFAKFLRIKEADGQTMIGTEVAAVFLKRRIQPVMARVHPMWLYSGPKDETRINAADLSEKELLDEVRRLTSFNQEDSIPLISSYAPLDVDHPPSGIPMASENTRDSPDDTSEGRGSSIPVDFHTTEQTGLEDEYNGPMNLEVAHADLPSSADNTCIADGSVRNVDTDRDTFVDAAAEGARASPAKRSTGGFADEDDLFDIDEGFIEPPPKKAKNLMLFRRSWWLPKLRLLRLPPWLKHRLLLPFPKGRIFLQLCYRGPFSVFASRFIEADKVRLQEEVESSSSKLDGAVKIAAAARQEIDSLKEELARLKGKLKEEEASRLVAEARAAEKDEVLRQSSLALLEAANIPVDALERVPNNSPANAVSTILASHQLTQELLVKGKGALARMHSMIFPKIKQEKTLGQLIDTFAVDTKEVIEVFKRTSRTFGAVLAFQLMMGYGFKGDIEEMTKGLPKEQDGQPVDLSTFKASALTCARQLLELVSSRKSSTGPSSSTQTQLP